MIVSKKIQSHDDFVEAMGLINPNIRMLGDFVSLTEKIKVECLLDGNVWEVPPRKLLKGVGCRVCSTKKNGQTHSVSPEQYREAIKESNPSIELLSDYVNARTKVSVKCLIDGYIWEAFPSTLHRGGCPNCARQKLSETKTLSHEEFVDSLRTLNPNIEILGTYTGTRNKVEARCIKHDYIWMAYPSNLISGSGCQKCKSEKMSARAMSHDDFVDKLSVVNPDIEVLGRYETCVKKISVRCKKHDVVWESTGVRLLNGSGCVLCGIEKSSTSQKMPASTVIARLKTINPSIELVGEFDSSHTKSLFRCLSCGNKWMVTFGNICLGHGCPACASSKGELKIKAALDSLGVEYKHQHIFEDCKNEQPLRFDFYISLGNIAIEFQGQQHFRPIDFAGKGTDWAEERFVRGQINDQIKREYCKSNNIQLVEIRYDEIDDIPNIISNLFTAEKVVSA